VAVFGLALLAAGIGLVALMRSTLTSGAETGAQLRANEVVAALEAGYAPGVAVVTGDEQIVQIVNVNGDVIAATTELIGRPAVAALRPGATTTIRPAGADEDYVVVAREAHTDAGALIVLVARGIGDVADASRVVTRILVFGLPGLLMLVGFVTWKVTGRALAPVERIRREVDEISAADLHRRVQAPSTNDEVASLAGTMNQMLDRLEGAQNRQRRFVSDASHELRSPVASIRHHAEVAIAHSEQTTVAELASVVLADGLRVQHLVEDLLLLARADERSIELSLRPVDVDDVVFDEASRLRSSTDLRIDTTGVAAARASAEPRALRRMLRNLGDNAARHARSRVQFGLKEQEGVVVLTIDDDGDGIPEDERSRVLERFVRLDDARSRDGGGSGLGLAIVAELAWAHHGDIELTSSPLGGVRVQVTLPDVYLDAIGPGEGALLRRE
jgi:signal transduction histidine kinase